MQSRWFQRRSNFQPEELLILIISPVPPSHVIDFEVFGLQKIPLTVLHDGVGYTAAAGLRVSLSVKLSLISAPR